MPRYETRQDVANELWIARVVAAVRNASAFALPPNYPADFALFGSGDTLECVIEVKCRPAVDKYDSYLVDRVKWDGLSRVRDIKKVPVQIVVYDPLSGRMRYIDVCDSNVTGERMIWNRSRLHEKPEPAVEIEWSRFTTLAIVKGIDCVKSA